MTLVRWDPFRELPWSPATDIFENKDSLVLRAELPGIDRNDIEVRVDDGILTLRGERKQESESREETAYRLERVHGTFERRFKLPTTVDEKKIEATYRNGILELVLPKIEDAKPRKVEIRAA